MIAVDKLITLTNCVLLQLEYLDLGRNQLSTIDPHALDGLDELNVLKLDDNRFSTVPSQSFAVIPHLFELHLGQVKHVTQEFLTGVP
jgi:Leucine-rich repeat (LRR) protein